MHALVYLVLLIGCCVYALVRGGAPERWGVGILIAAVLLSFLTPPSGLQRYHGLEVGFPIVDALMLVAVVILMLHSQRYWPMLMAAVLLDTVITHLLMLTPRLMPFSYGVMVAAWSYPNPLILAVAAWRHRRRMLAYGSDPSWNGQIAQATGCDVARYRPSGGSHGHAQRPDDRGGQGGEARRSAR